MHEWEHPPPTPPTRHVCLYLSAIATDMFFSLSLLDCGALTWAMTGLSSLFISSNTLSGFYTAHSERFQQLLRLCCSRWKHEQLCSPWPARRVWPPPQTSLCSPLQEPPYWWSLWCHRQTYLWRQAGKRSRRSDGNSVCFSDDFSKHQEQEDLYFSNKHIFFRRTLTEAFNKMDWRMYFD